MFFPMVVFISLASVYQWGNHPIPLFPAAGLTFLIVFIAFIFYQLRIKIYKKEIHLIYGIGLVKKTIRPERIDQITVIKTPMYYGLEIHIAPRGSLYNIHSLKAIKIDYLEGRRQKTVLIGTLNPEALMYFLLRRFKDDTFVVNRF